MVDEQNEESYVYKSNRKNIRLYKAPKSDPYCNKIGGSRSLQTTSQSEKKVAVKSIL